MEENRKELMEILEDTRPEIDFEKEKALIDDQLLDSFDIISIVSEINDTFDISINGIKNYFGSFGIPDGMYTEKTTLKFTL